ncbi:hypothetical protein ABZ687_32105 [Streptomyces ardesiacus]|uniref:Uncharacterized protein n=1 Tax=Streptomyces ardesiacus TaxID=285564 RepID=A0ABW8H2M4_9ACTN
MGVPLPHDRVAPQPLVAVQVPQLAPGTGGELHPAAVPDAGPLRTR